MKNKTWIISLIVILSILVVVFSIFLIFLLKGNVKFFDFKSSYKVSNELSFSEIYEEDIDHLNIIADMIDIDIKQSNEENIKVDIYGAKENTDVSLNQKELSITSKEKGCFGICFHKIVPKIEIFLPKDYDKNITIENNYGDVKIDEFIYSAIKINEDCGDVFIGGSRDVDIHNEYGDIEIKNVSKANVDASCGDIRVGMVNDIIVHNSYGDIDIDEIKNYLKIEEDCGDIKINNLSLKENSSIKNNFGDINIGNTNEIYIDAKTTLGDVNIKNNQRNAEIVLKLDNDCGDIVVNN